jgi:maltose O-acetyltransferase
MYYVALLLYYGLFRFLPSSDNGLFFSRIIRKVRSSIGTLVFDACGKNINIEKGANFGTGRGISVGSGSGLGINCKVRGPLEIGDDVMMGPEVLIMTSSHKFDRIDIPMSKQGDLPLKKVVIGSDVWIGARVIILPGITIGSGSIIGAGAVVTRDIPPFSVVGGVPARILKTRNQNNKS